MCSTIQKLCSVPLSIALAFPLAVATPVVSGQAPVASAETVSVPSGVEIVGVDWLTDRFVNLFIKSEAMPEAPVKVQLLLARDWHANPEKTFPTLYGLDGLLALPDESGWVRNTNIEGFFADKNVNVVLPTDAQSSFYTNWEKPENNRDYQWETFLTQELPGLLERDWHSNDQRGVFGISMGGTGAMNLMARNPELYDFAGSFSGLLDTTSYGMPEMIGVAMMNTGRYDARKMWGDFGGDNWKAHDPKLLQDKLKGKTVYVSAGNGNAGNVDVDRTEMPEGIGALSLSLETLSRMTAVTFLQTLDGAKDVNVVSKFRDSGTHDWPYWQYELTQAWPTIADSFALSDEDRGANCIPEGAIAEALKNNERVGQCLTGEYIGPGDGRIQEYKEGRAYWSPGTGPQFLWGRIGARYTDLGGPESWLGYPTSQEEPTPNGEGAFTLFQNGAIYWTAEKGAHAVSRDILAEWGKTGFEEGPLGFPTSDIEDFDGGLKQYFQNGVIVQKVDGRAHALQGAIAEKYMSIENPSEVLGMPKSQEQDLDNGGKVVFFEKGNIYWTEATGAQIALKGAIMDAWGAAGYERGKFGYPVSDIERIPSGGLMQKFQGGTIREIDGTIETEES